MTLHSFRDINGLVTKKWIFSRVGSRNQPFTEPEHGGPIVSEPFKQKGIGKPTQEHHYPKWGDDLDVMLDCGHMIKVPHQDVLAAKPISCTTCRDMAKNKKIRKKQALDRRIARDLAKRRELLQRIWMEQHNELERERRERRAKE